MPNQEVIDLSLSTDDEALPQFSHLKTDWSSHDAGPSHARSSYDLRTTANVEENYIQGPRKRLKLDSPIRRKDQISRDITTTPVPTTEGLNINQIDDESDADMLVPLPKKRNFTSSYLPVEKSNPLSDISGSDDDLPCDIWSGMAEHEALPNRGHLAHPAPTLERSLRKSKASNSNFKNTKRRFPKERTDFELIGDDGSARRLKSFGVDDVVISRPAKKKRLPEEERAARAREKEELRAAARERREDIKAKEKERRRLLREEKAVEKQKERDILKANKLKLDKKLTTPEMIVDLPISIDASSLDTQVRESLKRIGVETASYQSPVPNVIRWRRKVEARFDAQRGYRVQLTTKEIDIEKHVICFMAAQDFVSLATVDPDSDEKDLNAHVLDIRSAFDGCIPIYLIEGLDIWMNKNKNARNRAYKASVNGDVHNQVDPSTSGGCDAVPQRKKRPIKIVDENMIEDALLRLQVVNGCMVHHTIKTDDSAEWVLHFTEHISQIPYRYSKQASALIVLLTPHQK
ncbi:MAG: hypothetical protein Q9167_004989 [Letrouitia subvulpina]